jgi:hypothetical protein
MQAGIQAEAGHWAFSPELSQCCGGMSAKELRALGGGALPKKVWATALALASLSTKFRHAEGEWNQTYARGLAWLSAQGYGGEPLVKSAARALMHSCHEYTRFLEEDVEEEDDEDLWGTDDDEGVTLESVEEEGEERKEGAGARPSSGASEKDTKQKGPPKTQGAKRSLPPRGAVEEKDVRQKRLPSEGQAAGDKALKKEQLPEDVAELLPPLSALDEGTAAAAAASAVKDELTAAGLKEAGSARKAGSSWFSL